MSNPSSDKPSLGTDTAVASTNWVAAAAASSDFERASAAAAIWKQELPYRARPRPRAYGIGKYGVDRYDSRDDTRYGWSRVPTPLVLLFAAATALLGLSAPARATNSYCESADGTTSVFSLCKPSVDVEGANAWGYKWNTNADMIETLLLAIGVSTGSVSTMTVYGDLTGTLPAPSIAALAVNTGKLGMDAVNSSKIAGPVFLGEYPPSPTAMVLGHKAKNQMLGTDYALIQTQAGATTVNATSGQDLNLAISGTKQAHAVAAGGFSVDVTGLYFPDATLQTTAFGAGAVNTEKLAADAVDSTKILSYSVNTSKIATDAVDTGKVRTAAITTPKLADLSVDTLKLANSAVNTGKVMADAITHTNLLYDPLSLAQVSGGTITVSNGAVSISTPYVSVAGAVITSQNAAALTVVGNSSFTRITVGGDTGACTRPDIKASNSSNTGMFFGTSGTSMNVCAGGTQAGQITSGGILGGTGSAGMPVMGVIAYSTVVAGHNSQSDARSGLTAWSGVQGTWALVSTGTLMIVGQTAPSTSPVTGSITIPSVAPFGNANLITNTTFTIQGNAFSVGGATFAVSAGSVGIGVVPVAASTSTLEVRGDMTITGNLRWNTSSIDSTKMALASIDSEKMAKLSVDSEKIAALSVNSEKLRALSVNTEKLAADAVDSTKIRNFTIDTRKLAIDSITSAAIINQGVNPSKWFIRGGTTTFTSDESTTNTTFQTCIGSTVSFCMVGTNPVMIVTNLFGYCSVTGNIEFQVEVNGGFFSEFPTTAPMAFVRATIAGTDFPGGVTTRVTSTKLAAGSCNTFCVTMRQSSGCTIGHSDGVNFNPVFEVFEWPFGF